MQLNSLWKRTFSYSCWFFKGGKKPQATWFSGVLRRKQLGYWIKVLVHLIKAQIVATGHSLWPTVSSLGEERTAIRMSHCQLNGCFCTSVWLSTSERGELLPRERKMHDWRPTFPSGHVWSSTQKHSPCHNGDVHQKGSQGANTVPVDSWLYSTILEEVQEAAMT